MIHLELFLALASFPQINVRIFLDVGVVPIGVVYINKNSELPVSRGLNTSFRPTPGSDNWFLLCRLMYFA